MRRVNGWRHATAVFQACINWSSRFVLRDTDRARIQGKLQTDLNAKVCGHSRNHLTNLFLTSVGGCSFYARWAFAGLLRSCRRVTMAHSIQGSKTHPGEGSCMCPCTSLCIVKPCQHLSRKKQSYFANLSRTKFLMHFSGHPLPDRPQPRGNSLGKRSFWAKSNVPRGDEVESLLGASIFSRRVCRCEFSIFVENGWKIGNLVVSYSFDSQIGA